LTFGQSKAYQQRDSRSHRGWVISSQTNPVRRTCGHDISFDRTSPPTRRWWGINRTPHDHQQKYQRLSMKIYGINPIHKESMGPEKKREITSSKTFRPQLCRERRGTPRIRTGDPQVFRTPTCQLGYGGFWCSYEVLGNYEPHFVVATATPPSNFCLQQHANEQPHVQQSLGSRRSQIYTHRRHRVFHLPSEIKPAITTRTQGHTKEPSHIFCSREMKRKQTNNSSHYHTHDPTGPLKRNTAKRDT
jgi:hypothetical protein